MAALQYRHGARDSQARWTVYGTTNDSFLGIFNKNIVFLTHKLSAKYAGRSLRKLSIERFKTSVAVTRISLKGSPAQLYLPRAVFSCMTFCVSSRYSSYLYLYYIKVGKLTLIK